MRISSPIVQVYFLALHPTALFKSSEALLAEPTPEAGDANGVHPWYRFSWMGRHAVCAIREVSVTSGLDAFLLEQDGMPDIQDVAELMLFPFDDGLDGAGAPMWCRSLAELRAGEFADALGFVTFVRLNRGVLEDRELWARAGRKLGVPGPAELLRGTAAALRRATIEGALKDNLGDGIRLLMTAGTGDAEIVLIGAVKSRDTLDQLLFLLAKLGADSIGAALFGEDNARIIPAAPAIVETVTELLVPMDIYSTALHEAAQKPEPSALTMTRLNACMTGEAGGQLWLKRGASSLADLGRAVGDAIGPAWQDLTVLGNVDVLVQPAADSAIGELLWMLARVDAAAARSPGFPRKVAFQFTFSGAWGQKARAGSIALPSREQLFGFCGDMRTEAVPGELKLQATAQDIAMVRGYVNELRRLHWREDLRVIERMAERSVAVRKNETLPADTRLMADRCLARMSAAVVDIRRCEAKVAELQKIPATNLTNSQHIQVCSAERRGADQRRHLVAAGMLFDRALTHRMRGTLPLLLQPAFQARGPEHFSSEVMLSAGMAAFPASVVAKMIHRLNVMWTAGEISYANPHDMRVQDMIRQLRAVGQPILYSSHDDDFQISPLLGIIRIPRWVLWYPTASSMLVHEVGHALCNVSMFHLAVPSMLEAYGSMLMEDATRRMALDAWFVQWKQDGFPVSSWVQILEESCADVVWRVCCYDMSSADQFVTDFLDYLDVRSARMQPGQREMLLKRLLTSVVAAEQIITGWSQKQPQVVCPATREESVKRLVGIVRRFISQLEIWQSRHQDPAIPASCYLARSVRSFAAHLQSSLNSPTLSEILTLCGAGQLLAWLWLQPVLMDEQSPMRAQAWWRASRMVWKSVLESALNISHDESVQVDRIAAQLVKGIVPDETTRFPERLPTRVAMICSQINIAGDKEAGFVSRIPAHARFALSMYLQSVIITIDNPVH